MAYGLISAGAKNWFQRFASIRDPGPAPVPSPILQTDGNLTLVLTVSRTGRDRRMLVERQAR